MDAVLPRPEDHSRVQILVTPLGNFPRSNFERLIRTLSGRLENVEVGVSAPRQLLPKLVTEVDSSLSRFGEFQAFRKVFGLVCVGQFVNGKNGSSSSSAASHHPLIASSSSPDLNSPPPLASAPRNGCSSSADIDETAQNSPKSTSNSASGRLRRCSLAQMPSSFSTDDDKERRITACTSAEQHLLTSDELEQLKALKEQYSKMKQTLNDQLVDSRCAFFGFGCNINGTAECICMPRADDLPAMCAQLEPLVHELLRSIYFVLESRRLDTSFEKMESPPCPLLPDEEKYRMGLENVKSKAYRKKCIGRLRKKVGDYAFLTGLFESAIQSYQSAIDLLKSSADLLWLAAAYEGWCCAALMLKYRHRALLCQQQQQQQNEEATSSTTHGISSSMHRVQTAANALGSTTTTEHRQKNSMGHQRNCSDVVTTKLASLSVQGNEESTLSVLLLNHDVGGGHLAGKSSEEDEEEEAETVRTTAEKAQMVEKQRSAGAKSSFFGGGKGGGSGTKRKPWRQFLNFDSSSTTASTTTTNSPKICSANAASLPMPSSMSSASRSSSAHNLASLTISAAGPSTTTSTASQQQQQIAQQLPTTTTTTTSNGLFSTTKTQLSRAELSERFRAALENYARFSFAVHVEYECVMRAVQLLVFHREHIEVESFLREHTCRFLDDKFVIFDHVMKSNICLAAGAVYSQIGFRRKFAFFLRLAVFFRLFMDAHAEEDYRKVYPILNESLLGYGIGTSSPSSTMKKNSKIKRKSAADVSTTAIVTYPLQIKAVHEVCTVAVRAGLRDMAIRHLCFMLETFFAHLDKAAAHSLVEELVRLTKVVQLGKDGDALLHSLSKPLTLDSSPPVLLPPLQLTRIPILRNFRVLSLPAHLAPKVIDAAALNSKIFIYSPFQDRIKKDDVHWCVDCAGELAVHVQNPLPVDLAVHNVALITEGCRFDAIPVHLNLPSCFGSCIAAADPSNQNEVKLLGVPRSIGMLKITGYAFEVLGCRSLCKFSASSPIMVRVLPQLPLLRLECSLLRSPTLSPDPNDAVAEACVFTGQSFIFTITLHNTSGSVGIKLVKINIQQPQTCGGPSLFQIVTLEDGSDLASKNRRRKSDYQIANLCAGERKQIEIRIFGIDPTTTSFSTVENSAGKTKTNSQPQQQQPHHHQQRVFVRRPTSTTSIATIVTDSGGSSAGDRSSLISNSQQLLNTKDCGAKRQQQQMLLNSPESMPLLVEEEQQQQEGGSWSSTAAGGGGAGEEEQNESKSLFSQQNTLQHQQHDLIPYIGRLLSAEFSFSYTSDLPAEQTVAGEEYMRFAKLPIAVTIVPALNVSGWNVLAGDCPFSRYVVIDVTNQTDREAELQYGGGGGGGAPGEAQGASRCSTLTVQAKEACRVPLLCPCCKDIQSVAFQRAAQQPSHMMQMQEIDHLRRKLEKHLTKHLEIRWSIPKFKLDGQVPIGSLLSSVAFLRKLVLPSVTIGMEPIIGKRYATAEGISIRMGDFVPLKVFVHCSVEGRLSGELSLHCFQEPQNNLPTIDRADNMLICGQECVPFCIDTDNFGPTVSEPSDQQQKQEEAESWRHHFETEFLVAFSYEGTYKLRPVLLKKQHIAAAVVADPASSLTMSDEGGDDDIFMPELLFNVTAGKL